MSYYWTEILDESCGLVQDLLFTVNHWKVFSDRFKLAFHPGRVVTVPELLTDIYAVKRLIL